MQIIHLQLPALLVLFIALTNVNCAKTDSKVKPKANSKPQMGVPFAFKHANAAGFFDQLNQTATTTKKPKRSRRFSQVEAENAFGSKYGFSFKTLSELELPPTNEPLTGPRYGNSPSNFGEGHGETNGEIDRHSLDFLGRNIDDVAGTPETSAGKTRLTEKLIASLGAESQKVAANVTRASP